MNYINEITKYFVREEKKEIGVGKTVFKAVAITTAILAFVPTVFVKREDGFDGYGLLSRVGYKKSTDENGKTQHNVIVTLVDLSRYGIGNKKEIKVIVEDFAKRESSTYLIIDFNKASATIKSLFNDLMDLDFIFLQLQTIYNVVLEEVTAIVKKDITNEFVSYAKENNLEYAFCENNDGYALTLKGKAAHAMEPFKGINAGTYMCDFLSQYSNNKMVKYVTDKHHLGHVCEKLGLDYNDYEMGDITCNIGIMNISKSETRVTLDLRYPVRYDVEKFEKTMKDICEESNIEIFKYTHKTPHYVSPESNLVKSLYQAYVKNTNDTVNKPFTVGGGTCASMLENGVDEEEVAHQVNEYWKLESLFKSILIYIDAILLLGEIDAQKKC